MGKEQIPLCICPFSDRELRFGESACVAATGVFIPKAEIAGGFIGILTTDGTDFHGIKDTPNRFENVSITLSSSVPFRAIRGSISVFGVRRSASKSLASFI